MGQPESLAITCRHAISSGMAQGPTLRPGRQVVTTVYLPEPLYQWLKTRTVAEVDEHGRQLSMTKVIARYCQQARDRIEQEGQ
jgi:hypothetical protein